MNELLRIAVNDNQEQIVSGRELHMFLGIETPYTKWFERMLQYGFEEGRDYTDKNVSVLSEKREREYTQLDHIMKLDMAKELCMLARNEKGKQARQYFLEVEREWNSPEKVMARALMLAESKLNEVKAFAVEQTKQLQAAQPKVIFADAVASSNTTILIGDLAKIISQNGHPIGQKRLFEWMRENGYLIKRKGADYNSPTQRAMELKLFRIKETAITHSDGHVSVSKTVKVTGKGQQYFINKFEAMKRMVEAVQNQTEEEFVKGGNL